MPWRNHSNPITNAIEKAWPELILRNKTCVPRMRPLVLLEDVFPSVRFRTIGKERIDPVIS